jgi:hypothetical protein
MHFRTLAVLLLTISVACAADATYGEWAADQIKSFVAGKLSPPADKPFSHYSENGKPWTAGVAFVRSKTLGDGILVVPDLGSDIAYLAYKKAKPTSQRPRLIALDSASVPI